MSIQLDPKAFPPVRPSGPDITTNTALEATPSSSGKNVYTTQVIRAPLSNIWRGVQNQREATFIEVHAGSKTIKWILSVRRHDAADVSLLTFGEVI